MTLATFIARLKHWTSTAPEGDWWYLADGELRSKCCRCPITFVAKREKGKGFAMEAYDDAAEVLGLHIHTADKIVYAADSDQGKCDQELRATLLAACGVKEGR